MPDEPNLVMTTVQCLVK